MKQREALAAIRALGMTATVQEGEWRVAFPLHHYAAAWKSRAMQQARQEAECTYEYAADDAVSTARAMKGGDVRDKDAELWEEMTTARKADTHAIGAL